jgi:hypothetical protein
MKKFKINIDRSYIKAIEIEADNINEAIKKVQNICKSDTDDPIKDGYEDTDYKYFDEDFCQII